MIRRESGSQFLSQALLALCLFSLAAALIVAGSGPALLGLVLIPVFVFLFTPLHRIALQAAVASGRSRPPSSRAPPSA